MCQAVFLIVLCLATLIAWAELPEGARGSAMRILRAVALIVAVVGLLFGALWLVTS